MDGTREATFTAGVIAISAAAVIIAALVFQYGFGYVPCHLCLIERWPYYIGVPLAVVAAVLATRRAPAPLVTLVFGLLAINFLVSFGLGAYHSGIEWRLWPGPATCTAGAAQLGGNLLESLRHSRIVPCGAATWRFLSLSLAGWNAVASIALGLIALAAFDRRVAGRRP